jgi:uncharacterized protein YlxP (DUF503 family)
MIMVNQITEDEMAKLTDASKIGQRLKISIAKMKESYERKIEEMNETIEEIEAEHELALEEMQKRIEHEQQGRRNLEAVISKDRKETERKIQEVEAQVDTINMNFQMAVAGKASVEAKNTTLNEQKKVLVKEVKQLRKRVDDYTSTIDDLKALNDKLSAATLVLQKQLDDAMDKQEELVKNLEAKTAALAAATSVAAFAATALDNNIATAISATPAETEVDSDDMRESDYSREQIDELLMFNDRMMATINENNKAINNNNHNDEHPVHNPDSEGMSWELPQSSMKELGWISEEQNKLMQHRIEAHPTISAGAFKRSNDVAIPTVPSASPSTDNSHHEPSKRSSMSMFSSLLGSKASDSSSSSTQPPTKRGSMFSSILGSSNSSSSGHDQSDRNNESTHGGTNSLSSAIPSNATSEASDERMPSAFRLHCLRCQGTVEGPKFSTCRCPSPALVPEDLATNTSSSGPGLRLLSGFLSKGSDVAGGFMKATVHGVGSFMSNSGGSNASGSSYVAPSNVIHAVPRFGEPTDSVISASSVPLSTTSTTPAQPAVEMNTPAQTVSQPSEPTDSFVAPSEPMPHPSTADDDVDTV